MGTAPVPFNEGGDVIGSKKHSPSDVEGPNFALAPQPPKSRFADVQPLRYFRNAQVRGGLNYVLSGG